MPTETEFVPSDYAHFSDLPKSKQPLFREVDGGFVPAEAEMNPAVAQSLAGMYESARGVIHERVVETSADLDHYLELYEQLKNDYGKHDERREVLERLLEVNDDAKLRGVSPDTRLTEALQKSYTGRQYSERVQDQFVGQTSPDDPQLCATLLLDERLSHAKLFKRIETDDQRQAIFTQLMERPEAAAQTIAEVQDSSRAIDLFVQLVDHFRTKPDAEQKRFAKTYAVERLREKIASQAFVAGNPEQLDTLLREQYISLTDAKSKFAAAEKDETFELLSHYISSPAEGVLLGKFMADAGNIERIAQAPDETFTRLSPEQAAEVRENFAILREALEKPIDITAVGGLLGYDPTFQQQNKFIVGLDRERKQWALAWSNTNEHEYHKDVFRELEQSHDVAYPTSFRSGGMISIEPTKDGQDVARFFHSSGDFGQYNRRLLERSHDAITTAIRAALNRQDVDVEIAVSM